MNYNLQTRLQLNLGDLMAFVIPCLIFIEIRMVGRLFLPELILLIMFLFFLCYRLKIALIKPAKVLLALGIVWLGSQMATDLIRSTQFKDYSRGWANIVFFLIEFLTIYMLVIKSEKRLILFAVGISVGQILEYFIAPNIYAASGAFWKFGVGYAVTLLLVLGTQLRMIRHNSILPGVVLFGAAFLNFGMGTRSLGGVCFISGLYYFFQKYNQTKPLVTTKVSNIRLMLLILLLGVGGVLAIESYGYLAGSGLLGKSSQHKYELQDEGDFGLLIGGRQELLVSSMAIMDSPIIGHGSWAKNPKYIKLLPILLLRYGYDRVHPHAYARDIQSGLIPTHSFLFGAWVDAGFLGAVFWFWVMIFCVKLLMILRKTADPLLPVVVFVAVNMLWNIPFSPLGAETRFDTAYYLVFLMFAFRRLLVQEIGNLVRINAQIQAMLLAL